MYNTHLYEQDPVNWIDINNNVIKAVDLETPMTLTLMHEETKAPVNGITYFIISKDGENYVPVSDYSIENGVVTFKMPAVDKGTYYPQIMDNSGKVYSSLNSTFIEVTYNLVSRYTEVFPIIKKEIIDYMEPVLKNYLMNNADLFSGPEGAPGDDFEYSDFTQEQLDALTGPRGPRGFDGNRGKTGPAGPTPEFTLDAEGNLYYELI